MIATAAPNPAPDPTDDLIAVWQRHRVLEVAPPCLLHADVQRAIDGLEQRFAGRLRVEQVGTSFEQRSIRLLTLGHGERKILLWSQMHGDEPSATPAVLDLVNYLLIASAAEETGRAAEILNAFTLLIVPMLNPDGSERATRRSAQGIDINRDALQLSTPEARLLKRLREEHAPFLGFNLHDQDRRKLVGDTGVVATQAVLAVAGDAKLTLTEGRKRAMRVAAAVADEFARYIPGGIGRYDEDWSARSFGDNLTAWGTPIVLLESGGVPEGEGFSYLSALTFAGLVRGLSALARNDGANFSIEDYGQIPPNRNDGLVDVVLHGGLLVFGDGDALRLSLSDLAFDVNYSERALACASPDESISLSSLRQQGEGHRGSTIQELGDARLLIGSQTEDLSGFLIAPLLGVGVEGLQARALISEASLGEWARRGVGRVVWRVGPHEWSEAQQHALSVKGIDRASVEVILEGDLPTLRANEGTTSQRRTAAEAAPALTLTAAMERVVGERLTPAQLADAVGEARSLRRFGNASFMLLKPERRDGLPASGSQLDVESLSRSRIIDVWLNGRRLTEGEE